MTTLIGNICLALAALISGIMIFVFFRYKPPVGGDGGVAGYPILVLVLNFIFLIALAGAAITIANRGGFDWISQNTFSKYILVLMGVLFAVITTTASSMVLEHPDAASPILRMGSRVSLVIIPLILVVTGLILLNQSIRDSVPVVLYKWPLLLCLLISIVGVSVSLLDYIKSNKNEATNPQTYENSESIAAGRLREIEELDVTNDFVRLLEFTGTMYPGQVREKATLKIKTHPDLQNELIRLLENDYPLEAFNFLQSNEVDDKSAFAEPINKGIIGAADWIRHSIQGTSQSDFKSFHYKDEVDRVIKTVEKFDGLGVDYLPAIIELRSALDEPGPKENLKFDCAGTLDKWIESHQ